MQRSVLDKQYIDLTIYIIHLCKDKKHIIISKIEKRVHYFIHLNKLFRILFHHNLKYISQFKFGNEIIIFLFSAIFYVYYKFIFLSLCNSIINSICTILYQSRKSKRKWHKFRDNLSLGNVSVTPIWMESPHISGSLNLRQ